MPDATANSANIAAVRTGEAERAGVKSVPALVIGGAAFHINYGASLGDVKG